jgi:hypothetical protein
MFLIDTVVLSELRLRQRNPGVVAWIGLSYLERELERPDPGQESPRPRPPRPGVCGSRPGRLDGELELRIPPAL